MMIDTTDLIKSLEERKRQLSKWTDKDRAKERIDEIDCIIDTDVPHLVKEESEKPMNQEGLEKEIKRYLREEHDRDTTVGDVARHFAEWSARHCDFMKSNQVEQCVLSEPGQKPVPQELKAASLQIADNLLSKPRDYALASKADYWNGAHDGAIAGAKWQKEQDNNFERYKDYTDKALISLEEAREQGRQEMKEQILKEAVEGEYDSYPAAIYLETPVKGIEHGDKVRIIIVKEEE